MGEKKDGGTNLQFSLLLHNFFSLFKRLFWLCIVLALIVGFYSYRTADQSYVPRYTSTVVFSVSATFHSTTDIEDSSSYLDNFAAQVLATTFPYIIRSENAAYLLSARLGTSAIRPHLSAESTAESALFTMRATGTDPEEVYTVLMAAVDIYPQAAASVLGDTQLIVLDEPLGPPEKPDNVNDAVSYGVRRSVIGFVAGIVLIFLLSLTRKTLHSAEDVRKLVNLNCLSYVPTVKLKKRSNQTNASISILNPRIDPSFNESFRNLRVKIKRLMRSQNARILLITSTIPNEGKTTTAINLALSLASEGKRVVLIDGDLRKQTLKGALGISQKSNGLVEVLSGECKEQPIIKVPGTAMFLLCGDKTVDQTQPLLDSRQMQQLLTTLKEQMDYVIIDSPPAGVMADAATIAKHADACLYVVRQDSASTSEILNAIESISAAGGNLIGCVMNRTLAGSTRYGYGSKYTGGYSYSYGNKYASYGYHRKYSRYGYGDSAEESENPSAEDESET